MSEVFLPSGRGTFGRQASESRLSFQEAVSYTHLDIDKEAFKTYLELDSPSFLKCEFENGDAFTLYLALIHI